MLSFRSGVTLQNTFCKVLRVLYHPMSGGYVHPNPLVQPIPTGRKFKSKHPNPKFRQERGKKVIKMDLPNFHEKKESELSPEEIRTKMKKLGLQPPRPWTEKPLFLSSTGTTFEPYIPPEGDGKVSLASKQGAKQRMEFLEKKGKSMLAVRKIRNYDEDFYLKDFAQDAVDIYVKLHEALVKMDEKLLHTLSTERAYPLVIHDAKLKTLKWTFEGSIEPPRAVHARQTHIITKDNIFAQVTVRFHTQQTLAVYDRFGRLVHGSESVVKDVLEYIVFEKHLSNMYGTWRVHDKIVPPWTVSKPASWYTFKVPEVHEDTAMDEEGKELEGTSKDSESVLVA